MNSLNEGWLISFFFKSNFRTKHGLDLLTRWLGEDDHFIPVKRKLVRAGRIIGVTVAISGTGPRSLGNVPHSYYLGEKPEIVRIGRYWTKFFSVPCRPQIMRKVEFVHLEIKLKPGSVFVERDVHCYVCARKRLRQRARKKVKEIKNANNF